MNTRAIILAVFFASPLALGADLKQMQECGDVADTLKEVPEIDSRADEYVQSVKRLGSDVKTHNEACSIARARGGDGGANTKESATRIQRHADKLGKDRDALLSDLKSMQDKMGELKISNTKCNQMLADDSKAIPDMHKKNVDEPVQGLCGK